MKYQKDKSKALPYRLHILRLVPPSASGITGDGCTSRRKAVLRSEISVCLSFWRTVLFPTKGIAFRGDPFNLNLFPTRRSSEIKVFACGKNACTPIPIGGERKMVERIPRLQAEYSYADTHRRQKAKPPARKKNGGTQSVPLFIATTFNFIFMLNLHILSTLHCNVFL